MDLYLKYRPKKLSEIVSQKHVVATLRKSSEQNKFAHSYIFSGEKGTGKTSTARILSALLNDNVENGDLVNCESKVCRSIFNGSYPDVIELDGAKNRGVDDINVLIEQSQFAPTSGNKKVYIIDECHQLSSTAISALLKVVEEPPSYLVFIFCTTEFRKIPETIVSRSQNYQFFKIEDNIIKDRLEFISRKEDISIDDESLIEISKLADGSLRDAIGKLQQIWTVAGTSQIKADIVHRYFRTNSEDNTLSLFDKILSKDLIGSMSDINLIYNSNIDINHLLKNLSELFREYMLYIINLEENNLGSEYVNIFKKHSNNIKLDKIVIICKIFSKINIDLEYNINKRWVMESFVIDCINNI